MKRRAYRIEYGPETEDHFEWLARVVRIRAVGIKDRDRVLIGGEEIELR
jgi:hypothetical protein